MLQPNGQLGTAEERAILEAVLDSELPSAVLSLASNPLDLGPAGVSAAFA